MMIRRTPPARLALLLWAIPVCLLLTAQAALAAPGSRLWVSRYDDPSHAYDQSNAMGVSPDGSTVFVTGRSAGSNGSDYATVAYDAATGAKLWANRYDGPRHRDDIPSALGVSPDGSTVFVTGSSTGSGGYPDYATVAYDAATGAEVWVKRYDDSAHVDDTAYALGVSPDGSTVFVTGYSAYHYATVAYDAATGKQVWVERWNGPFGSYDSASALAVSPDGSTVFVTGSSDDPGNDGFFDYATVAYDAATGTQSWEMLYYDTSDAFATGLGVSPDGSTVFVTGYSRGSTGIGDYVTVAYHAATGNQAWATHYDGPAQGADVAKALGVSLDGSTVFVTGGSNGSKGHPDYATVAYDTATGTQVWAKRYGGRRPDTANALGVSPDGSTVFVTGQSKGSNRYDYATVAYDATTGTQMWVKRYDGPAHGDDSANALGVNPDGSTLFVTGGSAGSTGYDFATIAYSTA